MDDKKSIIEITSKFVSGTSSHGIPRIAAAKSWYGRILWSSLFLTCMAIFVWQAYLLINAYLGYEVAISIKVSNIEGSEIVFPAVTVCNTNPVRKSQIKHSSHFVLANLEQYSQGLQYYAPCKSQDFKCTNEKCVKHFKVCNGVDDCGDRSDEEDCISPACDAASFTCIEGSEKGWCIPIAFRCDRSGDCYDGSDESVCEASDIVCDSSEFKCKEGVDKFFAEEFIAKYGTTYCIGAEYKCDDIEHCSDGADEEACSVKECDEQFSSCGNGVCIPHWWLCDDWCDCFEDCRDEIASACPFVCLNGRVVKESSTCNSADDCGDNSDEDFCALALADCREGFFCGNGECISSTLRCNDEVDCTDGSDEKFCNCSGFVCADGECISAYARCNTVFECVDESDEAFCNESTTVYPTYLPHEWETDWYHQFVSVLSDSSIAQNVFEVLFPKSYIDWGFERIRGEFPPDWFRFLAFSNTPDFSDLQGVLKLRSSEMSTFGHQQQDFILQCSYNKKECEITYFKKFQHDKYGNCYTFNSGKEILVPVYNGSEEEEAPTAYKPIEIPVKTSPLPGAENGLKLTLNIEQHEYISIFGQDSGVKVSIHRQNETPFPEDDAITISPGRSTSVGIRMQQYTRQGEPYGNCTTTPTADMNAIFQNDSVYTVTACQKACLQRVLTEYCDCVDTLLTEGVSRCRILDNEQERCRQVINFLHSLQLTDCECRIPCSEIKYDKTISQSLWPSESYVNTLLESIYAINQSHRNRLYDLPTAQQNLVRLEVYYEDLSYTSISESPAYTWESLFGDIGGTLGLYIGLSMLTVVEFVEFVIDLVVYIINKVCNKNKVTDLRGGI